MNQLKKQKKEPDPVDPTLLRNLLTDAGWTKENFSNGNVPWFRNQPTRIQALGDDFALEKDELEEEAGSLDPYFLASRRRRIEGENARSLSRNLSLDRTWS